MFLADATLKCLNHGPGMELKGRLFKHCCEKTSLLTVTDSSRNDG